MKYVIVNFMYVNYFDSDIVFINGNKEENLRMSVKEDEGEEVKKNWLDSEVEIMVLLCWEMEFEFVGNVYKIGVFCRVFGKLMVVCFVFNVGV